tara:strand:+ start:293 stop:826 length:534 start_codon:yes stop_codon:yes gene_type:complete
MTQYVYVLTNEAMKGLVKIGMTTRTVEQRVKELQSTGVPFPFEVAYSVEVPNSAAYIEQEVHRQMAACRVSSDREFFLCSVEAAEIAITEQIDIIVGSFIDAWMPNHTAVDTDTYIDVADISTLANDLGVMAQDVASAFYMMTPEEFMPALNRWNERVRERRQALTEKRAMPPLRPE